jgi:hypothetical protein
MIPQACELISNPVGFLTPTSILWSPLEQYPAEYHCPKCSVAGVRLRPVRWQCGSNSQAAPRKIHGVDGPIILVGRVYRCNNGHEVLAYNADLLKQVPVQEAIPFELWHRTGFTSTLLELVHSLVLAGVSISAITETLNAPEMPFPSADEYERMIGIDIAPSRRSTGNVFLRSFWKKEKLYVKEMKKITVDKDDGWLSCDHTFASVSKLY